jgi:hypothetical protein
VVGPFGDEQHSRPWAGDQRVLVVGASTRYSCHGMISWLLTHDLADLRRLAASHPNVAVATI